MVLVAIIITSLTASSQTATSDTTHMRLPVKIMKSIAQDLLRKDSLEAETIMLKKDKDILSNNIKLQEVLITQKDSLIDVKNSLIISKDTIISLKDEQLSKVITLNKEMEKTIKKNNNKFKISTASSTLVIIILTVLHIMK
jgi:hypothetical protein